MQNSIAVFLVLSLCVASAVLAAESVKSDKPLAAAALAKNTAVKPECPEKNAILNVMTTYESPDIDVLIKKYSEVMSKLDKHAKETSPDIKKNAGGYSLDETSDGGSTIKLTKTYSMNLSFDYRGKPDAMLKLYRALKEEYPNGVSLRVDEDYSCNNVPGE